MTRATRKTRRTKKRKKKEKRKTTTVPLQPFHPLSPLSGFLQPDPPAPSVSPVLHFYLPIFLKPSSSSPSFSLFFHSPYSYDCLPPPDPSYLLISRNPSLTPSSTHPSFLPTLPTTLRYDGFLPDPRRRLLSPFFPVLGNTRPSSCNTGNSPALLISYST